MAKKPFKHTVPLLLFGLIILALARFIAVLQQDAPTRNVAKTLSWDMLHGPTGSPEHVGPVRISFDKDDNFLFGKSCLREEDNGLKCRDCGTDGKQGMWKNCPEAERRKGVCRIPMVSRAIWDSPKYRLRSDRDVTKFEHADINVLFFDRGSGEFRQEPCQAIQDCWDLQKCRDGLSVYAYGEQNKDNPAYNHASMAASRFPDLIRHIDDPSSACLLLVFPDSVKTPNELINSTWWNGGKNHLLFKANQAFTPDLKDWTFPRDINYGKAALASSSLEYTSIRRGYDIAIPLTHDYEPSDRSLKVSYPELSQRNNTNRPLLLSFRGQVIDGIVRVWWRFRWEAYEYWYKEDDVFVDITCKEKPKYGPSKYTYVELLLNSKFAFCPGGGGSHSYRLAEALGLGAIPVVTPDLPEPFELDWSGCWVRVSEARVIDLPRLLREISDAEIASRQRRCRELFDATLGWKESKKAGFVRVDPIKNIFLMTIKVWAARIDAAIMVQNRLKRLESY